MPKLGMYTVSIESWIQIYSFLIFKCNHYGHRSLNAIQSHVSIIMPCTVWFPVITGIWYARKLNHPFFPTHLSFLSPKGLCYHGWKLGIPVTVIMPSKASLMKIQKCRDYHANVIVQVSFWGAKTTAGMLERISRLAKRARSTEIIQANSY